ncbi:pectinesterase family protein [Treponema zioleckii]|uniref:pectinesterase family protein n=1 Tax=Treponema zioleckii TaxID=331680 RepID=UPI00168AFAFB|nr:pectinesterase family protein [Treponema zioleckii]
MKKMSKVLLAALLAASTALPLSAKPSPREAMTPTKNWNLYIPGKGNKKDAEKDLAKSGWIMGDKKKGHYELVNSDIKGRKVLKFNTLDGVNDALVLPLSGNEKKVSLIFAAQGAVDPDKNTTPYGILFGYVMKGEYQTLLRHNSSNQIKGSKSMSRLRDENNKQIDIVSDWHEYRMIFDVADPEKMTSKLLIDGKVVHTDTCKKVNVDHPLQFTDSESDATAYLNGKGNFLEFGDNDSSTNAFGRYAYLLVVLDEDVENTPIAELAKKANSKVDLSVMPTCSKDSGPKSKRPAKKPAGINIQGKEVGLSDSFMDRSEIENGTLDLTALPYSQNETLVTRKNPSVPEMTFAAKVGANEKYKTIASAIDAVPEGSAILVQPGLYYEKLVITKPGISLIGTDPAKTIIYGYEADTGGINGNILVEVNYLPKGTTTNPGEKASIPEKPAVNAYFNLVNITLYNKGAEWNKLWGGSERRSETLGLFGVDRAFIDNCIFLGQQDTIYFRSGRIYMKDSYIEGDVDYICGGATTVFDHCQIHTINYANGGIIVAAAAADTGYKSTAGYANGYVFKNCLITADEAFEESKDGKRVTLGRGTWVGGSATSETATGKTVYLDCDFTKFLNKKAWNDWDSVNTVDKAFFRVQNAKGAGASIVSGLQELNSKEAALYGNVESVLGFKPELQK